MSALPLRSLFRAKELLGITLGRRLAELRESDFPHSRITARYPNHVWMMDLTEIPGLFRLFSFKLALVFDVFSRMPLAWKIFRQEPSAAEIASLFEMAATCHGRPRHFISDRGSQFTSEIFGQLLAKLKVGHRFGAIGKSGSIALIERFWRTLKAISRVKIFKPLVQVLCSPIF